jgi:hypothetical protein
MQYCDRVYCMPQFRHDPHSLCVGCIIHSVSAFVYAVLLSGLAALRAVRVTRALSAALESTVATKASKAEVRTSRSKFRRTVGLFTIALVLFGIMYVIMPRSDKNARFIWSGHLCVFRVCIWMNIVLLFPAFARVRQPMWGSSSDWGCRSITSRLRRSLTRARSRLAQERTRREHRLCRPRNEGIRVDCPEDL